MPVIGRISVGDGATFTPAIDSDGVLSFSNNKNLPNPEPFDIPGAVVNSGAMAPGSENGTIAFGGNDVAVTGWDTKANVASPAFTGTPTAPTPTSTDDSTKLATTSFVQSAKTSAVTSANNYTDEQIRQHGNLPVGHEYFSMNPNVPQGSLPLLGGVYSRDTYADLWEWVQTQSGYLKTEAEWQTLSTANNGNVPYYSSGDGSTTFRVPSLHCWVKGSDGSAQLVGSYLQAGLPDIRGGVRLELKNNAFIKVGSASGAFVGSSTYGYHATGYADEDPSAPCQLDFYASRSNSIYGDSTTVQPESIVGMWLVKAYGTIVDTGTINEKAYMDEQLALNVPVGCVQAYAGQTTPQGWLLCDGSAISRTQYNKLFGVIGTSYGAGDGTSTFNLPNLTDKFIQGNATSGTEHSAGLPNITGGSYIADNLTYSARIVKDGDMPNSALYGHREASTPLMGHGSSGGQPPADQYNVLRFDASISSSIYGNSTTVQPPSVTMRYIIKY